jgi:putative spermidine/putrescine transport system substrate-binding protein
VGPKYKGKVLAYDNGDNFSFTRSRSASRIPSISPEQMQQVKAKLIDLKRNVLSFYTTADEALQIYKNNDVALIWANYGQQQMKAMKDAGAHVAYINAKEGALAWLDTWAMTSGVRDKDLAEAWVNFVLQKKIGQQLSDRRASAIRSCPMPAPGRTTSWSISSWSRIRQAFRSLERDQGDAVSFGTLRPACRRGGPGDALGNP